jgi:hypothetical protein
MAKDREASTEPIPEADFLEQEQPVVTRDESPEVELELGDALTSTLVHTEEADLVEQRTSLPDDDEDTYPRE